MTDREKAIVMAYTGYTMLAGDKLGIFYHYVQEKLGRCVMTHELAYEEVQDAIREAAKEDFIALAKSDNSWTSVNDRRPEEHADEYPYEFEQFLCATVWHDVRMVGFGTRIGDDKPHFWSGNSIWDNWVTHWMPKPEPPKEASVDADGA